ncbi:MAG: DUF4012 domain-containing protein [Anaerolineales bacterium]|nr:DUF4012 domain-containing protein [Anaerolineales bacterium]
MDGPRTYLLMVQNNDELRATGGFISAFGLITMDQGKVTSADFADSYTVFRNELPYPPAPAPMRRYMGIQLLTARDANWSPDLPTTAAVLRTLFERDTGVTIDGIITVDQGALRHLLTALGPVTVAGVAEPVTADNVNDQMIKFWEQPGQFTDQSDDDWWLRRKDFMGVVAKELMTRLEAGDLPIRNLIAELQAALVDRPSIMACRCRRPAALAANGWDGALHPAPGADFVAVVDANLGYNKVDAALQRSLDYSVTWPAGPAAPALAALTVTYTHTATTGRSCLRPAAIW